MRLDGWNAAREPREDVVEREEPLSPMWNRIARTLQVSWRMKKSCSGQREWHKTQTATRQASARAMGGHWLLRGSRVLTCECELHSDSSGAPFDQAELLRLQHQFRDLHQLHHLRTRMLFFAICVDLCGVSLIACNSSKPVLPFETCRHTAQRSKHAPFRTAHTWRKTSFHRLPPHDFARGTAVLPCPYCMRR